MKKILLLLFVITSVQSQSIEPYFRLEPKDVIKEFVSDKGEISKIRVKTLKKKPLIIEYTFYTNDSIILTKGTETYKGSEVDINYSEIYLPIYSKKFEKLEGFVKKINSQKKKNSIFYKFESKHKFEEFLIESYTKMNITFHKKNKHFDKKYIKVITKEDVTFKNNNTIIKNFDSKTTRIYVKGKGLVAFIQEVDGEKSNYKLTNQYVRK